MEIENILKLIDKVSDKKINYFCYEENNEKIVIKSKEKKTVRNAAEIQYVDNKDSDIAFAENDNDDNAEEDDYNKIISPIVGTFYSSSSEDGEPFIKSGDTVKKGQIIGIIEAMKIMNDIESPFDGVIESVNVENGQMVEYGQLLCRIK